MPSVSVSLFDPQPGKNAEALHIMKEAQEVIAAFGADVQVAQLVRGGKQGQLAVVVENSDPEAYGAMLDKLWADQGWQNFTARAQAADVATPVRSVDYQDIPGCELRYSDIASAGVIQSTVFLIREGKQQQAHERILRWKGLMEANGVKVRALQATVSDPFGLTAALAYYENFGQWGRVSKKLSTDAEWQAFTSEIRGPDPGADMLRTSLYRVV